MVVITSISITNSEAQKDIEVADGSKLEVADGSKQKAKRSSCPGIRVKGNRIYDSENGVTCHQCRQKTRDFAASCKNARRGKTCTMKLCHKCLLNRYGERAEEVEKLDEWICPKCRGICNCSVCMKKRGQKPTGILVRAAKASGFSSVSEMIDVKSPDNLGVDKIQNVAVSPLKESSSNKDILVIPSRKDRKENSADGNNGLDFESQSQKTMAESGEKSTKTKRQGSKGIRNGSRVDDACQNRSPKRPKISDEAPEEEARENARGSIKSMKTKRQGSMGIRNGSRVDDACQNRSPKRPKISDEAPAEEARENARGSIKSTKTKRQGSREICNGSRVDDTCQNRRPKRPKISDEAREEEARENARGSITICLEISEKEVNGGICVEKNVSNGKDSMDVSFNTPQKVMRMETSGENFNGAGVMDVDYMFAMNSEIDEVNVPVPLPEGTMLTCLSELEFPPQDVGHALQFLEFCMAFGKVLDIKKGEAEAILRELVRKQNLRKGQILLIVQFQVKLLTLILSESRDESPTLSTGSAQNYWLKSIHNLGPETDLVLKELELDCLEESTDGYYNLNLTKKLRLLNFLCDEALCTEKLRTFIEEQNSSFVKKLKGAKVKAAAAKEKERKIKQKLQDQIAKAIIQQSGGPSTISKHESLILKIKDEAAKAHAEMLEAKGMVPKRKQGADAMRTEPIFLDTTGHAFWKLNCYPHDCAALMQDINTGGASTADERWHVFGVEQNTDIDKYISSRPKRRRNRKVAYNLPNETSEEIQGNM